MDSEQLWLDKNKAACALEAGRQAREIEQATVTVVWPGGILMDSLGRKPPWSSATCTDDVRGHESQRTGVIQSPGSSDKREGPGGPEFVWLQVQVARIFRINGRGR